MGRSGLGAGDHNLYDFADRHRIAMRRIVEEAENGGNIRLIWYITAADGAKIGDASYYLPHSADLEREVPRFMELCNDVSRWSGPVGHAWYKTRDWDDYLYRNLDLD